MTLAGLMAFGFMVVVGVATVTEQLMRLSL